MECKNIVTTLFLVLAARYIFNLSYHTKVHDLMRFLLKKVAGIPSDKGAKKISSPVATYFTHSKEYLPCTILKKIKKMLMMILWLCQTMMSNYKLSNYEPSLKFSTLYSYVAG